MARAASLVVGEHDFTSFAAVDPNEDAKTNRSRMCGRFSSSLWERTGEELIYTVRGSGFLHHMVRNLVGTFILVGQRNVAG